MVVINSLDWVHVTALGLDLQLDSAFFIVFSSLRRQAAGSRWLTHQHVRCALDPERFDP